VTDDMNRRIRAAAGRVDPMQVADEAIAAAKEADDDDAALRERIAAKAGLPPGLAGRLRGMDSDELAADAKALTETLAELSPPEDFNTRIRRLAGRETAGADIPNSTDNDNWRTQWPLPLNPRPRR
jgi:hypothetical protein